MPLSTKVIPLFVVLYILSPIDILPDFIPGLGQIDDVALFLLGVQAFIAMSPKDLVARLRAEIEWRFAVGRLDGDRRSIRPADPDRRSSTSGSDQRSSASKEIIDG